MCHHFPVPISRRAALGLGLATTVAALTGCTDSGDGSPGAGSSADVTPSPSVPPTRSVNGEMLGEELVATLRRYLEPTPENPEHPTYAGAVALVTIGGQRVASASVGEALRYGAGAVLLPPNQRVPMQEDSIFDLASVTKIYTAILLLRLVDRGQVDLTAPVQTYLPEFAGPGKAAVTVGHLLSHIAALPVGASIGGLSSVEQRWRAVVTGPMLPGVTPGTVFRYSSVGLMLAGLIVERLTGMRLDAATRAQITEPLGLRETGFTPTSWLSEAERDRLVATDARSYRGLLRGVVHDEVCNLLGGVAGHAGLFSTAADLAAVGQLLLGGGSREGVRVLSSPLVAQMLTNVNPGLPAVDPDRPARTSDHGLGVELNQPWFMGGLSSPATFGHTGFTGTSILCDPRHDLVLVLLTNRAHPNWSWANPDPVRAQVATVVARHLA
jgi:CubicO group peptidase (beta-lactamase class C family)